MARRPIRTAWVGTDLQGQTWQLADLRGKAVLMGSLGQLVCALSGRNALAGQSLPKAYGSDKLVVLAVNFKESGPVVQRLRRAPQSDLARVAGPAGHHGAGVGGERLSPIMVLVVSDGRVVGVVRGEFDWLGRSKLPSFVTPDAPAGPGQSTGCAAIIDFGQPGYLRPTPTTWPRNLSGVLWMTTVHAHARADFFWKSWL